MCYYYHTTERLSNYLLNLIKITLEIIQLNCLTTISFIYTQSYKSQFTKNCIYILPQNGRKVNLF